MMSKSRAALAIPFLFLGVLLVVSGCGVGGTSEDAKSSSPGAGSTATDERAPDSARDSAGDATSLSSSADKAGATAKQAASAPLSRAVISTGQISLNSSSITKSRSEVMGLVTSWNGAIADEQTNSDDHGRIIDSTITLRVPTAKFSEAMNALGRIGEVEQQSRKSEDVTTKVIDNGARVRAAESSIRQIEALLGRAKELSDIIAIESDLARRQADLDSLKSQQAWLEDQTSLSTITVYLSRSGQVAPHSHEARGFLAGLEDGWNALKGATLLLLTMVGAALPFAVLVTLLGVPLWLVVRRRFGAASVNAGSAPARSV
jgi:hypothetical protein